MHKAGVSQLTLAGRGRHARTAGASQTRPPWSLPLACGGAGCSAGGHRNPRRGRVAEGPSARSVPPGGVRARPAAQAGEVRPAGAVRPRSLQASRCAPRSRGVAVAADMPARAVPDRPRPLKQPVGHEREHEHGKQCGQADPRGGNVRHQSCFGPGQRIAAAAARRLWHGSLSARVVDHHSWWLVSRVRISDTAKTWPLAVIGCRGLFLPDRLGSRAAMDPGLTWLNICSILICRT